MKEVVKSIGIFLIILGVIILSFALYNHLDTNIWLSISGLLIVGGLLVHIILNRYLSD